MKSFNYWLILPIVALSCLAFTNLNIESKTTNYEQTDANSPSAKKDSLPSSAQFYSRTHVKNKDGKVVDKITFKLFDGWFANAELNTDEKLGVFIDGSFFTEDDIEKLPVERTALLTFDQCEGIKLEEVPKDSHYAIPFCFVTKIKK